MPIELICQGCAKKLRMQESDAGKTARCPSCRTTFTVPAPTPSKELTAEQPRFYVRKHATAQSGPHTRAELDAMASRGELDASTEIKAVGDTNWLPATHFFPGLNTQAVSSTDSPFAQKQPQSDYPESSTPSPGQPAAENPYASPAAVNVQPRRRFLKPHRGGTILAMGVAGFCVCWFLGVGAFFMGMKDLGEMSRGVMDPSGRVLTTIGMTFGGISTAINVLAFIIAIVGQN